MELGDILPVNTRYIYIFEFLFWMGGAFVSLLAHVNGSHCLIDGAG